MPETVACAWNSGWTETETVKHSDIKYITIGTEIKCHHCAAFGGQHRNLKAGKMTFSWKDGNKFFMKVAQISLSDLEHTEYFRILLKLTVVYFSTCSLLCVLTGNGSTKTFCTFFLYVCVQTPFLWYLHATLWKLKAYLYLIMENAPWKLRNSGWTCFFFKLHFYASWALCINMSTKSLIF